MQTIIKVNGRFLIKTIYCYRKIINSKLKKSIIWILNILNIITVGILYIKIKYL